jgi:6-phosphofructokinase 2
MSPIITITFSPCIDKSASVNKLIPEKKLSCTSTKLEPGGGGINVARAIKKLGGESTAIYPSGGYTGKYFDKLMQDEEVPSIIIETENETRENIIILEESTNQQYRFGMPGTALKENEWRQCLHIIEEMNDVEFIVASGSLPPGVPQDVFARIAILAKKKNAKLIVDTSGEALQHAADEGVYMLKPNLGELGSLIGKKYVDKKETADLAKSIINKINCEIIIVSMGGDGAMLITKNENYKVSSPKVKMKSTVGAGDSMVAGIVLSLSQKKSLKETVQYGVACGTAATMNPGTELCKSEDAEELYSLIQKSPGE